MSLSPHAASGERRFGRSRPRPPGEFRGRSLPFRWALGAGPSGTQTLTLRRIAAARSRRLAITLATAVPRRPPRCTPRCGSALSSMLPASTWRNWHDAPGLPPWVRWRPGGGGTLVRLRFFRPRCRPSRAFSALRGSPKRLRSTHLAPPKPRSRGAKSEPASAAVPQAVTTPSEQERFVRVRTSPGKLTHRSGLPFMLLSHRTTLPGHARPSHTLGVRFGCAAPRCREFRIGTTCQEDIHHGRLPR